MSRLVFRAATQPGSLPGGGGGEFYNEPVGGAWTTHVDYEFTELPAIKWSGWENGTLEIINDAGEPGNSGTIMRHWHPQFGADFKGSTWNIYYDGGSTAAWMPPPIPSNTGKLYFAYYIRYSSNWWHPAGAGHKHWYLNARAPAPSSDVYDSLHFVAWVDNIGGQAGRLLAKFGTQWGDTWEAAQDNGWVNEEAGKALTKNEWHLIEYIVEPNTYGNYNGKMLIYVDNVLHGIAMWYSPFRNENQVDHFPNFRPSSEWPSVGWYSFEFVPIFSYGDVNGAGPLPPATQYFDLARFKLKYEAGTLTP